MATEREYLVSKGLAKAGRGKFSAEAHAALAEARQQGMTFDLPAYKQPKPAKAETAAAPAVTVTAPKPGPVVQQAVVSTPHPVGDGSTGNGSPSVTGSQV